MWATFSMEWGTLKRQNKRLDLMKKYKLIPAAGARPNLMKIAPLMHALKNHPTTEPILVHTGQHYDENMSDLFFRQLDITKPDILPISAKSHFR